MVGAMATHGDVGTGESRSRAALRSAGPLAGSGDDSSDGKALAPESDDKAGSIGLAARRWPPGRDLIGLGQVPALCC